MLALVMRASLHLREARAVSIPAAVKAKLHGPCVQAQASCHRRTELCVASHWVHYAHSHVHTSLLKTLKSARAPKPVLVILQCAAQGLEAQAVPSAMWGASQLAAPQAFRRRPALPAPGASPPWLVVPLPAQVCQGVVSNGIHGAHAHDEG